jgi:Helix-turn-helix domain of resolvase
LANFPRSLMGFKAAFRMRQRVPCIRWPDAFCCPDCGHDKGCEWRLARTNRPGSDCWWRYFHSASQQTRGCAGAKMLVAADGGRAGCSCRPNSFLPASLHAFIKPTSKLAQPQKPSGLNETEDSLGEPRQASMPPRVRGRKEDRPKALTSKKVQQVLILYNAKKHTIDEICRSFNISRLSYIDTLRH